MRDESMATWRWRCLLIHEHSMRYTYSQFKVHVGTLTSDTNEQIAVSYAAHSRSLLIA